MREKWKSFEIFNCIRYSAVEQALILNMKIKLLLDLLKNLALYLWFFQN